MITLPIVFLHILICIVTHLALHYLLHNDHDRQDFETEIQEIKLNAKIQDRMIRTRIKEQ